MSPMDFKLLRYSLQIRPHIAGRVAQTYFLGRGTHEVDGQKKDRVACKELARDGAQPLQYP